MTRDQNLLYVFLSFNSSIKCYYWILNTCNVQSKKIFELLNGKFSLQIILLQELNLPLRTIWIVLQNFIICSAMALSKQIELQFSAPNLFTCPNLTSNLSLTFHTHSIHFIRSTHTCTHPASCLVVKRPRHINGASHVFHREGSSKISPCYLITNSRGCN